jgi:outer membrane protein assembly factor BamB
MMANSIALAGDWAHWRGPEQNGVSREKNLPSTWSLEGENLVWKSDIGGRAAPIVLNGRVYLNCRTEHSVTDPKEKIHAREQVVCWDAETGKEIWKDVFNVFQTDIPAPRVGWASMVGDPETGNVFVHSVSGIFRCYTGDGKVVWEHSLEEEYGKISGYGGRTHTPIIDEDLIIVSYLSANWGETKGPSPAHTYYAFDKKTGQLAWVTAMGAKPEDTTYSCPIVSVIHGQRMLIGGNADGAVYAMNARTGKKLWGHEMSRRGLNVSPVVDGDLVYITHGEDNLDTTDFGRVECLRVLQADSGEFSVETVWRVDNVKAGYASPVVHDGILYVVADTGSLHAFDSKTGKKYWEHQLGTVGKGSPVWGDGKLYVMEVDGNIHILKPTVDKCETLSHLTLNARDIGGRDEIYASPAISNGRVYFVTRDRTICIGAKNPQVASDPIPEMEAEVRGDDKVDLVQLRPYEIDMHNGDSVKYEAFAFNKNGRLLKKLPAVLKPGEGLDGVKLEGNNASVADIKQQLAGTVQTEVEGVSATARIRVFPELPWQWDFEGYKGLQVPPAWIRAHVKMKPTLMQGAEPFVAKEGEAAPEGLETAMKLSPGPGRPGHTVYIGPSNMKDYTIQADVLLKEDKRKLPSIGINNQRYSLIIKGNNGKLSIQSWQAHLRMAKEISFRSNPDVWYTMKLTVEVKDGIAHCKGKVWERGKDEPQAWTIEAEDPHANEQGSPGLNVYLMADCYFDNVIVSKE